MKNSTILQTDTQSAFLSSCGSQKGFDTVTVTVILEDGELPCVLPLDVHLDLGHLPDPQGYSGLLSEPCTTTQTLQKL